MLFDTFCYHNLSEEEKHAITQGKTKVRPAAISTHFDVTWLICPAQRFYEQPLSYKYGIGDGAECE